MALSMATGKVVWVTNLYLTTESASNVLGLWATPILVGGLLYVYAGYSRLRNKPDFKISIMACINATTGATVWLRTVGSYPGSSRRLRFWHQFSMGFIIVLGKGQTSTSVSVQTRPLPKGTTVQIQGNVLDQSPAQPGTPAVSDSSMSEQMDYLHMQNATLLNSGYSPHRSSSETDCR